MAHALRITPMDPATALALPRTHSPRVARLHAFRDRVMG